MDRPEPTLIKMMPLRLIAVMAMVAIVAPLARAADQTTAVWTDGHSSSLSDEELTRNALASPGPAFPEEAQKAKTAGSGLYELRVNKGGTIAEVVIVKSSGSAVLDKAAKTAFMKWRFKPAIFARVRVPVSWSVNRVR
ncbi:MAG TPA: energy transducer TonB [Chthoniobacterales bacterium]|jgi:TonB family protein